MIRIPVSGAGYALVDPEDFDRVSRHRWHAVKLRRRVYAQAKVRGPDGRRRSIYMHRLVANAPRGTSVDHRDHQTLDNRKKNLRVCTQQQNTWNQRGKVGGSSRFKGVCETNAGNFKAQIRAGGKRLHLGTYPTEDAAARAYDDAARRYHGEFAALNFGAIDAKGAA